MAADSSKNKITLSNSLIMKHDQMSMSEYRIFFTMLSTVNKKESATFFDLKNIHPEESKEVLRELTINELCLQDNLNIRIGIKELCEMWETPLNKSYDLLKKASSSFSKRGMTVERISENGKKRFEIIPYVSRISYEEGSAFIEIEINRVIMPYIAALSREYTIFKIENMKDLTSASCLRLYEILKKNQSLVKYVIKVDELEKLMFTSFQRRNAFISKLVDKNIDIINQASDLLVTYEIIGRGSNSTIEFNIREKTKLLVEENDINKEPLIKTAQTKVDDPEGYVDFILRKAERRITSGEVKNVQSYISAIIENDSLLEEYEAEKEVLLKKEKKKDAELLKKYLEILSKEAEKELKKRENLVYTMIPELEERRSKLRKLNMELTTAVLTDKNRANELRTNIEEENQKIKEMLGESGFKEEFLEMKYKCNICKDTCIDPDTGAQCICKTERLKEAKEKKMIMI